MALFIGLDPSYKEYGVAIIDTEKKLITLDSFGEEINQRKNKTVLKAIPKLVEDVEIRLLSPLMMNQYNLISVGMELDTAMTSRNQAICYALDYATYDWITHYTNDVNLYTTNYISTIQREAFKEFTDNNSWLSFKNSTDKKIYTQHLATQVLSYFYYEGWTIDTKVIEKTISGPKVNGRYIKTDMMSSGEADAFIIALRQFVKEGFKLSKNDLTLLLPKLEEDKEID